MSEDDFGDMDSNELKRPAVSLQMYTLVETLADQKMEISASDVSWQKCLAVVIGEYVDEANRKTPINVNDYRYD